ncbi:MAG: hypothetical protein ACRDG5_06500 [Anaerolineales bacterium]
MRALNLGERVIVGIRRRDGWPLEFTWRGRRHRVREATAVQAGARPGLRCRTESGLRCLLAHDPAAGVWRLERIFPPGG